MNHANDELVLEVSGRLKPFLLQLRGNYTTYELQNIPRLKSTYSIRLYELLSQYRLIGKRTFELRDLMNKIGCSYAAYGHFKHRVLSKSQKDLEEKTDLRFDFEEEKDGRKVVGVIFYIYPNDPKAGESQFLLPFMEEEFAGMKEKFFSNEVLSMFRAIGISMENLDNMLVKGFNIIESDVAREKAQKRCKTLDQYYVEKLTLVQQSKAQKNPAGFFVKAIREDWLSPEVLKKQKIDSKKREASKNKKYRKELEQKREEKLKEYDETRQSIITSYFSKKPRELNSILQKLHKSKPLLRSRISSEKSPEENYNGSPMIHALVNLELEKKHPELFTQLDSIKEEIVKLEKDIASVN
jgi:hypothetical protein